MVKDSLFSSQYLAKIGQKAILSSSHLKIPSQNYFEMGDNEMVKDSALRPIRHFFWSRVRSRSFGPSSSAPPAWSWMRSRYTSSYTRSVCTIYLKKRELNHRDYVRVRGWGSNELPFSWRRQTSFRIYCFFISFVDIPSFRVCAIDSFEFGSFGLVVNEINWGL